MSPIVALLLGAGLAMEATSLRTAPKPVISREQFREAAKSLDGLTHGTVCLFAKKAKSNATKMNATKNIPIIGDGTPLPLEKLNWEIEDFNPEALERGPCGIKEETIFRVGKGDGLTTPQAALVVALKLWITEIQKGVADTQAACERMDKNTDKKVDEEEFVNWIKDAGTFDGRVVTPEGEVMDAMWQVMKQRGEDFMNLDCTAECCKKDLDKLIAKMNTPQKY